MINQPMRDNHVGRLLLTENEAAERLRLHPNTLSRLRKSGQLGYIRCGRAIRYSQDDLAAWIAANAQGVRNNG